MGRWRLRLHLRLIHFLGNELQIVNRVHWWDTGNLLDPSVWLVRNGTTLDGDLLVLEILNIHLQKLTIFVGYEINVIGQLESENGPSIYD